MNGVISAPDTSLCENQSRFHAIISQPNKGWWRFLLLFWALIGPGLLAAMADNDAGGMISYCVTGVQFGIGLFIPLVLCLAHCHLYRSGDGHAPWHCHSNRIHEADSSSLWTFLDALSCHHAFFRKHADAVDGIYRHDRRIDHSGPAAVGKRRSSACCSSCLLPSLPDIGRKNDWRCLSAP